MKRGGGGREWAHKSSSQVVVNSAGDTKGRVERTGGKGK